jgi:riboflavin synthase alpha subunit
MWKLYCYNIYDLQWMVVAKYDRLHWVKCYQNIKCTNSLSTFIVKYSITKGSIQVNGLFVHIIDLKSSFFSQFL